jgi:hypothetical protein
MHHLCYHLLATLKHFSAESLLLRFVGYIIDCAQILP